MNIHIQHQRLQVRASNVLVQQSYTTERFSTDAALVHWRNEVLTSYVEHTSSDLVLEQ